MLRTLHINIEFLFLLLFFDKLAKMEEQLTNNQQIQGRTGPSLWRMSLDDKLTEWAAIAALNIEFI